MWNLSVYCFVHNSWILAHIMSLFIFYSSLPYVSLGSRLMLSDLCLIFPSGFLSVRIFNSHKFSHVCNFLIYCIWSSKYLVDFEIVSWSHWPSSLKAWVYVRPLAGIACSNPAVGMEIYLVLLLSFVWYISLRTVWSLVQRSPNECDVCERDRETWNRRRPRSTYGCFSMGEIYIYNII